MDPICENDDGFYSACVAKANHCTPGGNIYGEAALVEIYRQVRDLSATSKLLGWLIWPDTGEAPRDPATASHLVVNSRMNEGGLFVTIEPTLNDFGRALHTMICSHIPPTLALRCLGRFEPSTTIVMAKDIRLLAVDAYPAA